MNQKKCGKQHGAKAHRDHQQHRLVARSEQVSDALPPHITPLFWEKTAQQKRQQPSDAPQQRERHRDAADEVQGFEPILHEPPSEAVDGERDERAYSPAPTDGPSQPPRRGGAGSVLGFATESQA